MRHLLLPLVPLALCFFIAAQDGSQSTGTQPVTTAGGTVNKIAKFDGKADITNSQLFDNGTNVGVGTSSPSTKLDVNGGATIRGSLFLPATGNATHGTGKSSQPMTQTASVFNSSTGTAVAQNFRWQAEPVANDTANASGSLNLLYFSGTNPPQETGLNINPSGQITFATGQAFPGTAQLSAANTFTGNQTVNGNVAATAFSGDGSALTSLQGASVQGSVATAVSSSFSTTATTANNALMLGGLPPSAYAPAGSQPAIVASVSLTNLQGDIPTTTLINPLQNATYRLSGNELGLSGCNSNPPAIVYLNWNDDGSIRGAAVSSSDPFVQGWITWTLVIRVSAGTPLTYSTGANCTPYELYMTVEQLQ
jgi:hypothetical protein